MVHDNDCVLLI
ncbi:hypothetical protein YPPY66_2687, partial [Yersinia pestis PY-66]